MRWEYRTLAFETELSLRGGKINGQELTDELNRLGEKGWELVNVFDTNTSSGSTREVFAVLKRPLETDPYR